MKKRGEIRMTKCDFCTKSSPNGKCYWSIQSAREYDCKNAIERMSEALGKEQQKKKRTL